MKQLTVTCEKMLIVWYCVTYNDVTQSSCVAALFTHSWSHAKQGLGGQWFKLQTLMTPQTKNEDGVTR